MCVLQRYRIIVWITNSGGASDCFINLSNEGTGGLEAIQYCGGSTGHQIDQIEENGGLEGTLVW